MDECTKLIKQVLNACSALLSTAHRSRPLGSIVPCTLLLYLARVPSASECALPLPSYPNSSLKCWQGAWPNHILLEDPLQASQSLPPVPPLCLSCIWARGRVLIRLSPDATWGGQGRRSPAIHCRPTAAHHPPDRPPARPPAAPTRPSRRQVNALHIAAMNGHSALCRQMVASLLQSHSSLPLLGFRVCFW